MVMTDSHQLSMKGKQEKKQDGERCDDANPRADEGGA
jgi:hypothetical protein